MKVYLDNCCFNRPFDDQSQMRILLETEAKLDIQRQIRSGHIQLAWSYMIDFENSSNPFEDRKQSISLWKTLANTHISESQTLLDHASIIHAQGLKAKDALHLACAIVAQCDYFITTDKGILNKADLIPELEMINPLDYHT